MDHLKGHRCKDSILATLAAEVGSLTILCVATRVAVEEASCSSAAKVRTSHKAVWVEKSLIILQLIVVAELNTRREI